MVLHSIITNKKLTDIFSKTGNNMIILLGNKAILGIHRLYHSS